MNYVCGCSEMFGDGRSALSKLPTNRPTFRFDGRLPGFTQLAVEDFIMEAFNGRGGWSEVCDLKLDKHPNTKTNPTNIVIDANLGRSGVLADQQLPVSNPPLQMRINNIIAWVVAQNPPAGQVDLLRTLRHELGHFIGLSHFPVGGPKELMEPSISEIRAVQPTEAALVAKIYGEPQQIPVPPGTNAPDQIVIESMVLRKDGKRYTSKGFANYIP